jgi:hypothetical protein
MYPSNFLNNYLTERDLKEFVNSNRYLDSHSTIIKTLDLESHYFTILKRLFPNIPTKKKKILQQTCTKIKSIII